MKTPSLPFTLASPPCHPQTTVKATAHSSRPFLRQNKGGALGAQGSGPHIFPVTSESSHGHSSLESEGHMGKHGPFPYPQASAILGQQCA